MKTLIKKAYQKVTNVDPEFKKALKLIEQYSTKNSRILDVGCGYGRFLKPLKQVGYQVTGVEVNQEIVDALVKEGLECMTPDQMIGSGQTYDVILMSHIIEHFTPTDLFKFIDNYLDVLSKSGHLIILTPIYSKYFYDDFDHIKPYHPTGIQMVYGKSAAQVQFNSKHHLELIDLWFRKSPWIPTQNKAIYLKTFMSKFYQVARLLSCVLYRSSAGLLGRKDGWVGIFQKT